MAKKLAGKTRKEKARFQVVEPGSNITSKVHGRFPIKEMRKHWCRIEDRDGSTVAYIPDHVTAEHIAEFLNNDPID